MLPGCFLRGGSEAGCFRLTKQERVGLWPCSINTPGWAGNGGGSLEHPWHESNWIQTSYEILSIREIKSRFPGTAGGSTFQYKRRSGERH